MSIEGSRGPDDFIFDGSRGPDDFIVDGVQGSRGTLGTPGTPEKNWKKLYASISVRRATDDTEGSREVTPGGGSSFLASLSLIY